MSVPDIAEDAGSFTAEWLTGVISDVLGLPDENSTKKIAKWDRGPVCANLNREARRSITVWLSSPRVGASAEIFLDTMRMAPATPPKNSNCSPAIKTGPAWFAYVRTAIDAQKLSILLKQLTGDLTMDKAALDTIEEEQDDEVLDLPANQKKVFTQSRDESIEALVSRIRKGRLILQPDFQRDYVWSRTKASALVESLLMRIPLPVIYVAEMHDGSWEVVDGQQRLTAIRSFIDGRFPDGTPFNLGALRVRSDLRNKKFSELTTDDQHAFEDYSIRVIMIQKEADEDLKFEVFERLNSGADKLNDMELRNCVYRGTYNDLLKELSHHELLLKIRGEETPDTRMQDRQLILRFFAMWRSTHLRYRGPMNQFMNHEMQAHRFAAPDQIAELRKVFDQTIQCAWDIFGEKAFRRYSPGEEGKPDGKWEAGGKLNIALWDTLMHVFSYYERRQLLPIADALREEFLDLFVSDPTFVDYIGRTTDKPDRVRYRAEAWKKRVDSLVALPQSETRNFSASLKQRLFQQDPTCRICLQRIQSLDDSEVDHIEHYWRGGRTIPENARLTHRYCNRKRGGRK